MHWPHTTFIGKMLSSDSLPRSNSEPPIAFSTIHMNQNHAYGNGTGVHFLTQFKDRCRGLIGRARAGERAGAGA